MRNYDNVPLFFPDNLWELWSSDYMKKQVLGFLVVFLIQVLDQVISVIVFLVPDLRQLDPSFLEWTNQVSIQAAVETAWFVPEHIIHHSFKSFGQS